MHGEAGEKHRRSGPGPVCLNLKFSSGNLFPWMDLPPVPLPAVKSPPCLQQASACSKHSHGEQRAHEDDMPSVTAGHAAHFAWHSKRTWHMNCGMTPAHPAGSAHCTSQVLGRVSQHQHQR